MDLQAARWLIGGEVPGQAGNYHPVGVPTGVYRCRDGSMIIQAANNRLYQRLCRAIDAPELIDDPRFSTSDLRRGHREEMTEELERCLVSRNPAEWQSRFDEAGVPAGPVLDVSNPSRTPRRDLLVERPVVSKALGAIRLVGHGVNLERTPPAMRSAATERGEHTEGDPPRAGLRRRRTRPRSGRNELFDAITAPGRAPLPGP